MAEVEKLEYGLYAGKNKYLVTAGKFRDVCHENHLQDTIEAVDDAHIHDTLCKIGGVPDDGVDEANKVVVPDDRSFLENRYRSSGISNQGTKKKGNNKMSNTMKAAGETHKVGDEMTYCDQKRCRDGSITLTQKKGTIRRFRTVKQALVRSSKGRGTWIDLEETPS